MSPEELATLMYDEIRAQTQDGDEWSGPHGYLEVLRDKGGVGSLGDVTFDGRFDLIKLAEVVIETLEQSTHVDNKESK